MGKQELLVFSHCLLTDHNGTVCASLLIPDQDAGIYPPPPINMTMFNLTGFPYCLISKWSGTTKSPTAGVLRFSWFVAHCSCWGVGKVATYQLLFSLFM